METVTSLQSENLLGLISSASQTERLKKLIFTDFLLYIRYHSYCVDQADKFASLQIWYSALYSTFEWLDI